MNVFEPDNSAPRMRGLLFVFAFLLFLVAFAAFLADRAIFQPPPRASLPEKAFYLNLQESSGKSSGAGDDARIAVLHFPAPEGRPTFLYSHGNAEDLNSLVRLSALFRNHGYGILVYDYEGYGASSGVPSEPAAYRDVERCWTYLTQECRIPPRDVFIYGRSVGSGPSIWLAERKNPGGLILQSPFLSAFSVVGASWLPWDRFPNEDRISNVRCPILILHGDADRVVPYSHGVRLFELADAPKNFFPVSGGGHDDLLDVAGQDFWNRLREFSDFQTELPSFRK